MKKIAIGVIVVLGLFLRVWGLNESPPSLGFDEAALGYNAYSILKTGKDEYGNFLPLSLRSFNDYKPALYAYLTIPFVMLGGLTGASVRMVSALSGVVSLIFLYLILKKFIKNDWLLIFVFLVLSFEPWRLHFSRNAFETHLSSMFFIVGVWFLIGARNKFKKILAAVIFMVLAAYSYHSARLAGPLLLLFWAIDPIAFISRPKKIGYYLKRLWPLMLFVFLAIPIFLANSGNLVLTRFNQENVFKRYFPYAPKEIVNPITSLYYFGAIVSGHVFSYISPINLNYRIFNWVKGSPQFIPGMGMLGWLEGMVFLVGLVVVIRRVRFSEKYRFLVYWIVGGIAPAAATWNWYHPLRSLNIFPALEVIVGVGIYQLYKLLIVSVFPKILKKVILGFSVVVLLVTIVFTINNELLYSAFENHGEYQPGGFKEGMAYLKSIQGDYDQVIIDSSHAQNFIFLFFYEPVDPALVQKYADIRPRPGSSGNLDFNFDKFVFRKIDWPKDRDLKRTVFWTAADVTDEEILRVPGAKIRKVVNNVLYKTAKIVTTE